MTSPADFADWEPDRVMFPEQRQSHRLFPDGYASPAELHQRASGEYAHWSALVRKGGHLMLPWPAVSALVGPLLPAWLMLVGARAKGGKSTLLRSLFDAWVTDFGKRILYVGTEQNAGILRALWACLRCRLPESAADPLHPDNPRVEADVQQQASIADRAMIVAEPSITIDIFKRWARVAWKEKCDVVMFDHFHALEDTGTSQTRSRTADIREIKNVASKSNMLVVVAAQLKNASEDAIGEFEVPGAGSWAESAGLRRWCDVAIQAWRPLKPGVTRKQKGEAKDDPAKLAEIIQENVMAIRCDAHRYPPKAYSTYRAARLTVNEGELTSWGAYHNGQISDPAEAE
jgi:hypothetical protein